MCDADMSAGIRMQRNDEEGQICAVQRSNNATLRLGQSDETTGFHDWNSASLLPNSARTVPQMSSAAPLNC